MKVRFSFVSNSSSSSFVTVVRGRLDIPALPNCDSQYWDLEESCISIPQTFGGKREFGWEQEISSDFGSKLNWAILQANATSDESREELYAMIDNVLSRNFHLSKTPCFKSNLRYDYNNDENLGYIDHQSIGSGMEIFDSEEELEYFLFCPQSHIETDNDNH